MRLNQDSEEQLEGAAMEEAQQRPRGFRNKNFYNYDKNFKNQDRQQRDYVQQP